MPAFSSQELQDRIKRGDPQAYKFLLESEGADFFTFATRLALGNQRYAAELFRLSLTRAFRSIGGLGPSIDTWLYSQMHRTWLWFFRDKAVLGARASHLSFDWTRPIGKQTEGCLELLSPTVREIFLLRVMKKFSLSEIRTITAFSENRIEIDLAEALGKLVVV